MEAFGKWGEELVEPVLVFEVDPLSEEIVGRNRVLVVMTGRTTRKRELHETSLRLTAPPGICSRRLRLRKA